MPKLPISVLAAIAGLALAQPAVAQDQPPAGQSMPAPDPARLAAAKVTVDHIFPAGTYQKMLMGGGFSQMMDQMTESVAAVPMADLLRAAGKSPQDMAKLGKATLADVMEIMDPAYKQRQKAAIDAMMPALTDMVGALEPSLREGLVNVYAERFTLDQLNDMNRFFATPSGSAYASNAMLIQMDPEVLGRMSKEMPQMIQSLVAQLPAIQEKVKAETANLPKPREYKDLTPTERARLATLLGVDEKDLEKSFAATKDSSAH